MGSSPGPVMSREHVPRSGFFEPRDEILKKGCGKVKITVKLGAPLSQVVGESSVQLQMPEGSTLANVLDALQTRFPDFEAGLKGKGLRYPADKVLYTLFVDAKPVPFDQAQGVKLRDGNRVYLFLPVAGG